MYNKTILITGGTGTVGKHLLIYLLENENPKKIIVYSRDEFKQHNLKIELSDKKYTNKIKYIIGDIKDIDSLNNALYGVEIVFHTAAIKHVPIAEDNPFEAIKTNIFGTQNIIQAAINNNVESVISISTDKSVISNNLYGSTKLCMEKLTLHANTLSNTKFSVIRFGNILCSRGSVIPVFLKLRKTGKINITDKNVTRFTINIDQMTQFITKSANTMIGGEIFIPKLPAYSLGQLVDCLCNETDINVTGLKPGERLHEYMISEYETGLILERDNDYVICPSNDTKYTDIYGTNTVLPFLYSSEYAQQIDSSELMKQIDIYQNI